ncbi:DUF5337 domain-containing protein [Roseobacter sp. HKCCA0434]|uniref:DUF5337 domain-containing protein n=1 Tax=Roseobacter sp. HKCCA0434 TaxID=3079297 RepID=UPI002905B8D0|nr:DUF5337 domain-containing protein [Roseobacter sp. HKCCA0434]
MTEEREAQLRRQTRAAAAVIVIGFLGWMGFSLLGAELELPVRFAFLADFAMLAALIWALYVLYNVRRARRSEGD